MAAARNDSRCAACGKAAGTFTCRGCSKDFCMRHANEHRQELAQKMDEDIIPLHDQLRQILDEQAGEFSQHLLNKQIDEWEQTSIEKIHQVANDARKQLLNIIKKHTSKTREALEDLTQQLKIARDDDHFFETDLKEWMRKLDTLKKDLVAPQIINIQYANDKIPFISKILIGQMADTLNECFEQALGTIQITNNGTVITHNQPYTYASVHGRHDYSSGVHRLRFVIEHLSYSKWIFLGVVSESAPKTTTTLIGEACYGFSGADNVWCDGVHTTKFNGYTSDFETNDTIEFVIDCDQQKIRLINERTRSTHILDVDIAKCPFPWKLSVGLYHSLGERIRILS